MSEYVSVLWKYYTTLAAPNFARLIRLRRRIPSLSMLHPRDNGQEKITDANHRTYYYYY